MLDERGWTGQTNDVVLELICGEHACYIFSREGKVKAVDEMHNFTRLFKFFPFRAGKGEEGKNAHD